jgi:hypothetical protein
MHKESHYGRSDEESPDANCDDVDLEGGHVSNRNPDIFTDHIDCSALNKEAPIDDRRFLPTRGLVLDGANLLRLGALRALGGLEFHPLPLLQ